MSEASRARRKAKRDPSRGEMRAREHARKLRKAEDEREHKRKCQRLDHWYETVNPLLSASIGTEHELFVFGLVAKYAPESDTKWLAEFWLKTVRERLTLRNET